MARIKIEDLDTLLPIESEPRLYRLRWNENEAPDITLINLNLMLVNQNGRYDQQNYLPLGLLYIASFLGEKGINAELVDYQLFTHARLFDPGLFIRTLGETAPIVGFSCMTNLFPFAVLCARELKKASPDCRIVFGGVGPSPVARQVIEAFPFIDSVVTGEGEMPLLDLLTKEWQAVPGRQLAMDLDELPLPAYSLIDFKLYGNTAPSIISSRGCPYRCTFCTEPHNFGGLPRLRSINSICRELEMVHSLSGSELFLFQDDILPLNRPRFFELLKAVRGLSFPLKWKCFSRVDLTDGEIMKGMVESGSVQIRFGIESGSNRILQRIQKGFTIEKAYRVTRKSLEYFPSVHVSFIWGYPFETMEDFEETLVWVSRFEEMGASVLLFEFSPLPGSQIYLEHSKDLCFDERNYSFFVIMGSETIAQDQYRISDSQRPIYDLIKGYPEIFPGFYTYSNTLKLRKTARLYQFNSTRRTPTRNEYDL